VQYLTASPSLNTCEGLQYNVYEIGAQTCCTAAECGHDPTYYFNVFMDALSLREMAEVKAYVKPGTQLIVDGNIVDEPLRLSRNTSGKELEDFKRWAPGWAGGDVAYCEINTGDKPEAGKTEAGKTEAGKTEPLAQCRFGGGGTHFKAEMERVPNSKRWYVLRLHGESH
jgi:hypothetical protein